MKTTVALNGRVFDLHTPERAADADSWIARNLADTSGFADAFPDAQALSSVLSGSYYHLFPEATSFGDNGWIPSVRVVLAQADGTTETRMRDLPELGTFPTVAKAQDRGRSVQVVEFRKDGSMLFAHEQK